MQAMESGVKEVVLLGDVTLDIEALTEYSGHGECGEVILNNDTAARYSEELMTWTEPFSGNWSGTRMIRDGRRVFTIRRSTNWN